MKTYSIVQPPVVFGSPQGIPAVSRLAGLCRVLLSAVCIALVSFVPAPGASAAAPDGQYEFTSASGTLSAGGDTYELPQDFLEGIAAIQSGKITVKDKTVKLSVAKAAKIIEDVGDQLGLTFDVTITGPKSIKLKKSGTKWVGATTKPLVINFQTTFNGDDVSGEMVFDFKAKVKGKTLTLTADMTGNAIGMDLTGELTIVCKRP